MKGWEEITFCFAAKIFACLSWPLLPFRPFGRPFAWRGISALLGSTILTPFSAQSLRLHLRDNPTSSASGGFESARGTFRLKTPESLFRAEKIQSAASRFRPAISLCVNPPYKRLNLPSTFGFAVIPLICANGMRFRHCLPLRNSFSPAPFFSLL